MAQDTDTDTPTEQRLRLEISGAVTASGEFEITPITAGEAIGHNVRFSAGVLRDSLPLWDGVECFIDHTPLAGQSHSVRDLGGLLYAPTFDDVLGGIKTKLRTTGPSGPLLDALGREMLNEVGPKPRIGFSADVLFTVDRARNAMQILRVYTVDCVFDPARGGSFLRALNSAHSANPERSNTMSDLPLNSTPAPIPTDTPQQIGQIREDMQALLSAQSARDQQMREINEARISLSAMLLDAGLKAAELPAPMEAHVRKQFTGKAVTAGELSAAIADARKLVTDLSGGQAVSGLTHAREMFDSGDQIRAAVDDLFQAERDPAAKNLKVARLSGIRELYLGLTGDDDFHGGYYGQRVRFNTGNFAALVSNVMNKCVVTRWNQLGRAGYDWWQKVATVEHFNDLKQITWIITGTASGLSSVSKGAEYTPLFMGDGKETSDFAKYGNYVGIDLEDMINDDTRKLRAIPRELASAGIRNLSSLVAAIFSTATYTGPTMADGAVLFNNTAVTTVGGHANLTASALGTDYTAWNALALLMFNQPMLVKDATGYAGTGKAQAIKPSICLTCPTLGPSADSLFVPRWASQNYQGGASEPLAGAHTWGGKVDPVVVPEISSTTWWAAVIDPVLVPGIMIGEAFGIMPEVFVAGDESSPAVFMNDEVRVKVRHHIAVGVADFRPLGRGNV